MTNYVYLKQSNSMYVIEHENSVYYHIEQQQTKHPKIHHQKKKEAPNCIESC